MRTTLTLDDDLAMILKRTAETSGRSFKDVVNEAIRAGLAVETPPTPVVLSPPHSMGRPLVDLTKAHALAYALDDEKTMALMRGERWPKESDDRP